jgi:hypothetical protein
MRRCVLILTLLQLLTAEAFAAPKTPAPPAGVPVVVDSKGNIVGQLLERNFIVRDVGGTLVYFGVNPIGLDSTYSIASIFLFRSDDCSGPRYLGAQAFPVQALVDTSGANPKLYYPGPPYAVKSIKSFGDSGDHCSATGPTPTYVGAVLSTTIKITPPLRLKINE